MKEKELKEMSLDELKKKEKTLKFSLGILVGSIIGLLIVCVIITIKKGFQAFTIMPIAFLPIIISSFSGLKKLQAEINSRSV